MRRQFMQMATGASLTGTRALRAASGLGILILGGTQFIGAHMVASSLAWYLNEPVSERPHLKAGPTPERERELLAAWRAHGRPAMVARSSGI